MVLIFTAVVISTIIAKKRKQIIAKITTINESAIFSNSSSIFFNSISYPNHNETCTKPNHKKLVCFLISESYWIC